MANSGMVLVHEDERRTIHQVVHDVFPSGPVTRVTRIDVICDNAVLGNHYHPSAEHIIVQAGGGRLLLAPSHNPTDVTERKFGVGEAFTVPGSTAHALVCKAGTVLVVVTDWIYYPAAVFPAELVV